jgi:hypothetical protein
VQWTVLDEHAIEAMVLFREHDGLRTRLMQDPMAPCRECRFVDGDAAGLSGPLEYWLSIDWSGGEHSLVFLGSVSLTAGTEVFLDPIVPNPAHSLDRLSFSVPTPSTARIELIDVAGRIARVLWEGSVEPGRTVVAIDPATARVGSGVYWVRVTTGRQTSVQRLVVVE